MAFVPVAGPPAKACDPPPDAGQKVILAVLRAEVHVFPPPGLSL